MAKSTGIIDDPEQQNVSFDASELSMSGWFCGAILRSEFVLRPAFALHVCATFCFKFSNRPQSGSVLAS